jgi:hypothetical protein
MEFSHRISALFRRASQVDNRRVIGGRAPQARASIGTAPAPFRAKLASARSTDNLEIVYKN